MSQKKATIVNLASSNVSVSQFSAAAGTLVLEQFYAEEIAPGLTGDEEWLNAAIAALANLVNQHGLKGRVTVIAPAFLLLQKPLKVAQVEKAKQAQIVAFEAQNAIPYPLNEVIWDSQLMASDGVEAEVLLFALRTEVATRIANLVTSTGLRAMSIQAAPLLDSQAFRLGGGSAAEEVLIVNVGARSTTLSFVGPSGVNIQTATNMGGNLLTQGISDNTGQPFATSEAIKVGYFSGVLQLAESDPQVAVLQANAQTFIRRLAQDINRRLINVRRGANGRQPARILITGRGSQVPGLAEQLCETLRLGVEPFDPSSVITPGEGITADQLQRAKHQITEVIGEAARLVLAQPSGVNLIPRDIAAQQAFDARKPRLLAAAALAAAAPFCVWLALASSEGWNNLQIDEVRKRQDELAGRRAAIEESRKQATELAAKCKELEHVILNRSNWPAFLGDLQSRVGTCKNTWVEEMHVKYETLPTAPATDGQPPAPPVVVTKVILSVRFLFTEVPFEEKRYRSAPEKAHIARLVEAVRSSPYVSKIPENEISVTDQNTIRTPKATLTLVIQKDKAL
ncbi:MAG: pilus assembly protein PilM [Opitutales bacterium]|jgi:type IV pilus assembly protein PilM|nr:pilus assembly protein PilM [Opitutales bacterium]MDP4775549.1 pilus assembly protein PilM [Opitutales bacterium]MDP4893891.1 pilus assembly protein PilM [Opitutales bacterium]MDP5013371.1 pilus assembly protein PilM [Opitutales bacterium]